jgi:hypothetical protein
VFLRLEVIRTAEVLCEQIHLLLVTERQGRVQTIEWEYTEQTGEFGERVHLHVIFSRETRRIQGVIRDLINEIMLYQELIEIMPHGIKTALLHRKICNLQDLITEVRYGKTLIVADLI